MSDLQTMRLAQTMAGAAYVYTLLRNPHMRTDRHDEQWIRDAIEAMQDFRQAKGAGPSPHDMAYSAAFFLLRRLKSKGWQFSPPLPIPSGGIMTGARKGK